MVGLLTMLIGVFYTYYCIISTIGLLFVLGITVDDSRKMVRSNEVLNLPLQEVKFGFIAGKYLLMLIKNNSDLS